MAVTFLAALWLLSHFGYINHHLPVWYSLLSFFSALTYKVDKELATAGERRIAEKWMHCLDLLGGWPGAMFAQHAFRHKTIKMSFKAVYWLTVILNICALGIYITASINDGMKNAF